MAASFAMSGHRKARIPSGEKHRKPINAGKVARLIV
jgi:hypothetical protein